MACHPAAFAIEKEGSMTVFWAIGSVVIAAALLVAAVAIVRGLMDDDIL